MIHSTTILAVRHRDHAVLAGDGQVTFGQTVVKQSAKKIRRLYNDGLSEGDLAVTGEHGVDKPSSNKARRRSAASTTTGFSPALPAPRPTRSRCSRASSRSSNSSAGISNA